MKVPLLYLLFLGLTIYLISFPKYKGSQQISHRLSRKHGPVLNPRLEHIVFDPLVRLEEDRIKDLQRRLMDFKAAISEEPAKDDDRPPLDDVFHADMDLEQYFDKFTQDLNISARIETLFPHIDSDSDGHVTLPELTAWHLAQARNASLHRTDADLKQCDTDHDGKVTLEEYLHDPAHGGAGSKAWPEHTRDWLGRTNASFLLADRDGDGKLDRREFNDFLNPEDSDNPKLQQFLREEEIRERDTDKDVKLSFHEFMSNMYSELRDGHEASEDVDNISQPSGYASHAAYMAAQTAKAKERHDRVKAKFDELDVNRDGFITEDELSPVMERLQPSEAYYARVQSESLIKQADKDNDGQLTLAEMLAAPHVFYEAAYDDSDERGYFHDEF